MTDSSRRDRGVDARSVLYLALSSFLVLLGVLLFIGIPPPFGPAVGTSVIATGIANGVMFFHQWVQRDRYAELRSIEQSGLIGVYDVRGAAIKHEYDRFLLKAHDKIDIIGFGQSHLLADFFGSFETWKEHAHVRILLLDPAFPTPDVSLALLRDDEEGLTPGQIRSDVDNFLNKTRHLWGTGRHGSFNVKLYRAIPTMSIFRIDSVAFWGPYLLHGVSRNDPTLLVKDSGTLYGRLTAHFDEIWNNKARSHKPK